MTPGNDPGRGFAIGGRGYEIGRVRGCIGEVQASMGEGGLSEYREPRLHLRGERKPRLKRTQGSNDVRSQGSVYNKDCGSAGDAFRGLAVRGVVRRASLVLFPYVLKCDTPDVYMRSVL